MDGVIDHIGVFIDKHNMQDYIWLICWLFSTYSIYMALLATKKIVDFVPLTFNQWLLVLASSNFLTQPFVPMIASWQGITDIVNWVKGFLANIGKTPPSED